MLGRHVGRVSCRPASEKGGASKERVNPERTSGRQAEGEEEREGQQTKRRKAAEKGTEKGKRENPPLGPKTERTEADRTQPEESGAEEARGEAAEPAGSAKTTRQAGTREQHEPQNGDSGAEFAASGSRERSPVAACQGRRPGSYRFQTIPCLHWEASRRTFANVNCRHRTSS